MSKFTKALPPSDARVRLRELIAAKKEAREAHADANARIDRLTRITSAVGPARAALSELDGREAREFADWSASPPGTPVPATDGAARAALVAALADCQTQSDAASRAMNSVQADAGAAVRKVAAIDSQIGFAAATVALEEMSDIEAEAKAAMTALAAAKMKANALVAAVDSVRDGKDMTYPGWVEYTRDFVAASDKVMAAFGWQAPAQAAESEFTARCRSLMADLRSDAGSRLHL
jgi:hypothetical protein